MHYIVGMNKDLTDWLTEVDVAGSPFDADNYWRYRFRLWHWYPDDQVEMYREGEGNGRARLRERQVAEIKWLLQQNVMTVSAIARLYGVGRSTITSIRSGRNWPWVEPI